MLSAAVALLDAIHWKASWGGCVWYVEKSTGCTFVGLGPHPWSLSSCKTQTYRFKTLQTKPMSNLCGLSKYSFPPKYGTFFAFSSAQSSSGLTAPLGLRGDNTTAGGNPQPSRGFKRCFSSPTSATRGSNETIPVALEDKLEQVKQKLDLCLFWHIFWQYA